MDLNIISNLKSLKHFNYVINAMLKNALNYFAKTLKLLLINSTIQRPSINMYFVLELIYQIICCFNLIKSYNFSPFPTLQSHWGEQFLLLNFLLFIILQWKKSGRDENVQILGLLSV